MDRRSALQFGSGVFVGVLTGCLGHVNSEPESVSVSDIVVRNRTDREVELTVLLSENENENVVYWQSVSVPAQPNPFANLDDLPDKPGAYELYARISSSNDSSPVSANLTEEAVGQSCIKIGLELTRVEEDGKDVPAVVFGTISDC